MDEIFETVNGVLVRVAAHCHYCKKELSARSSGGTDHLSRHAEKCKLRHGQPGISLCLGSMLMVL